MTVASVNRRWSKIRWLPTLNHTLEHIATETIFSTMLKQTGISHMLRIPRRRSWCEEGLLMRPTVYRHTWQHRIDFLLLLIYVQLHSHSSSWQLSDHRALSWCWWWYRDIPCKERIIDWCGSRETGTDGWRFTFATAAVRLSSFSVEDEQFKSWFYTCQSRVEKVGFSTGASISGDGKFLFILLLVM